MAMRRPSDLRVYRRLLSQARPYWIHLAGIFFLSLLAIPLGLLTPLPLKIIVDSALGSEPLAGVIAAVVPRWLAESNSGPLFIALGLLVFIAVFSHLRGFASGVLETYTAKSSCVPSGRNSSSASSVYHSLTMTARERLIPSTASNTTLLRSNGSPCRV